MSNSTKIVRAAEAARKVAVNEIESNFQPRIPYVDLTHKGAGAVSNVVNNTTSINYHPITIIKNRKTISIVGLKWFSINWKAIAIAAASAAAIYAIAKMIQGLNKSIKVRYNSCAKTLLRMQKDFTLEEAGLSMRAVLPGVGSNIMDRLAHWYTASNAKGRFVKQNHKGEGMTMADGVIGLYPFCNKYKDEITLDFQAAVDAFNKIAAVGETADKETGEGPKGNGGNESLGSPVYSSFREAFRADHLDESLNEAELNEVAVTAVSAAISLGMLAVRGGMFIVSRVGKNGKAEGEQKAVQVTKESTREVCYAILNNYGDRYVNMAALFKKAGIDGSELADLDKSSCDKLAGVLKKYGEAPSPSSVSKQYARVKKMYDGMLKHYYNIGDGLINNFVEATTKQNPDMDEKHKNLLLASKEKLLAMWDSQKDTYDNSFSRIMIEITSCENYQNYLNFIVERVIPVFKSGIAGDADYILDVMPKKGEYYVLRQTQQDANAPQGEANTGNVSLALVQGFDMEKKEIKFTLEGLIKSNVDFDESGAAEIEDKDGIDKGAYSDGEKPREVTLAYGKWLALDPHITEYGDEKKDGEDDKPVIPDGPVYIRVVEKETKEVYVMVYIIEKYLYVRTFVDGKEDAVEVKEIPENIDDKQIVGYLEQDTNDENKGNFAIGYDEKKDSELLKLIVANPEPDGKIDNVDNLPSVISGVIEKVDSDGDKKGDEKDDEKAKETPKSKCYARAYVPEAYAILGVDRDADEETIKHARNELAKKLHTDKNVGNSADVSAENGKMMTAVNDAYEKLEGKNRAEYDSKNPEGTVVVFATVADQEVARSFTRPFSSSDSLNEDGESDSGSSQQSTALAVRDEQKPADSSATADASAPAEAPKFDVIRVVTRIGDKIESAVSYKLDQSSDEEAFKNFITQPFFGGHENDPQYRLGFTELEGDASEYYNADVTSSVNVTSEEFVKKLNEFSIKPVEGEPALLTDTKATEDFMPMFTNAAYFAVVRSPENKWAWIVNPNPDGNAKKAVSDAQVSVSDVKIEAGASEFVVTSKKIEFLVPNGDAQNDWKPFFVKFTDNGYNAGSNTDPKAKPSKVEIKMNAMVCGVPSQQAVVFGGAEWKPEVIAKGLAQKISELAKSGYQFRVVDQKSTAVNSSVDITYAIGSSIEESAYDSAITVSRSISSIYRGYYILSESHVYDATSYDPAKQLSESAMRIMKTAKSKGDVMKYAKSRKNARFSVFETESTYKIRTSVMPSYYAPLYESVVAFRFDENGKVADYINFGVKVTY